MRFDISHPKQITAEQLRQVENIVNQAIRKNYPVTTVLMTPDEAIKEGATALFGEKYGDIVRVVSVPNFSIELCGGSHVKNVGQIGRFKIISESGVAAGVRRIEAITGRAAIQDANKQNQILNSVSTLLKVRAEDLTAQVEKILAEDKAMKKQIEQANAVKEQAEAQKLLIGAKEIGALKYLAGVAQAENMDKLREIADFIVDKIDNGVAVLAAVNDGKVNLVVKADKKAVAAGVHSGKGIRVRHRRR
jgi:alanyl-tRNA synthetase